LSERGRTRDFTHCCPVFYSLITDYFELYMRTVYGIGETICDIIFKDEQPQAARAGGSTFNALVSLGRMQVNSTFISKIGDDKIGQFILNFMRQNHISTDNMSIWQGHKTDIALAFLNDQGDAEYSFYKAYDQQFVEAPIPDFKQDDILLFGSYFALNPLLRPLIERLVEAAKAAKAIIYYDPNFRSSHAHEVESLRHMIYQNMEAATIVRGSDEDFENIFAGHPEDFKRLSPKVPRLITTRNAQGVDVVDGSAAYHFPSQRIVPVSTIGAGDSFNAGFIYGLLAHQITYDDVHKLSAQQWESLVNMAILFSTEVCQSYDNYISEAFAQELINV